MSVLGALHAEQSKVRAIAEERCTLLFLPIEKIGHLFRENPEWVEYIFKLYHRRFEELLDVVNALAFKKMDDRIWELLNKKRELYGQDMLPVTHEQLAQELGTSRVVVSRLLKHLEDDRKIKLGRNKIVLV